MVAQAISLPGAHRHRHLECGIVAELKKCSGAFFIRHLWRARRELLNPRSGEYSCYSEVWNRLEVSDFVFALDNSLTATLCTLPADNAGLIFFQSTGDSSKPTMPSSTLRACCASTRLRSMSRGFSIAFRMASWLFHEYYAFSLFRF